MTTPPSPRFAFPVSLDVAGRRCVVAGGGPLARDKADALRAAGAKVLELAPDTFDPELVEGAFLLVVSGEDATDDELAFRTAERHGVLTNILDDVPHCHFAFPSTVERGDLTVAVSTAGRAPALARRVRLHLEDVLPDELGPLVDAYAGAREQLLPREVPFEEWAGAWRSALTGLDDLLALCADGRADDARDRIVDTVRGQLAGGDQPREVPGGEHTPFDRAPATAVGDSGAR